VKYDYLGVLASFLSPDISHAASEDATSLKAGYLDFKHGYKMYILQGEFFTAITFFMCTLSPASTWATAIVGLRKQKPKPIALSEFTKFFERSTTKRNKEFHIGEIIRLLKKRISTILLVVPSSSSGASATNLLPVSGKVLDIVLEYYLGRLVVHGDLQQKNKIHTVGTAPMRSWIELSTSYSS